MKLPFREKMVIALVLLLVVLAWTVDSALHPRIENSDLNNVAVMVTKDLHPALFPTDVTFAKQSFYQAYTPIYRALVGALWQWQGSFEGGLVWLVPVVLTVYLAGMFVLLYALTANQWVALGLTIVSAHYHDTMGAEVWGVGGSSQLMARAIFMAVVPYIALWFFLTIKQTSQGLETCEVSEKTLSPVKIALLGLFIGLAANLHPGSGMHLAVLLASTLIILYGFRRATLKIWLTLPLMVLTTFLGALPIVRAVTNGASQPSAPVPFAQFKQAVAERYALYFYPPKFEWSANLALTRPMLDGLVWFYLGLAIGGLCLYLWVCWRSPEPAKWWRWAWLGGGLITVGYAYLIALFDMGLLFGLVACYIIYRFWYANWQSLDGVMLAMAVLVILQSLVGYYLSCGIWETFELTRLTPLLIEQFRAARFIYLPIYVWAGLALNDFGFLILRHLKASFEIPAQSPVNPINPINPVNPVNPINPVNSVNPVTPINPVNPLILVILVIILFGPLAPLFAPISPIPTVNLLEPANRVPTPPWPASDTELYSWVRGHTAPDALFFWCDFGTATTLRFRREAQRGITHHWKDLGWATYQGTTLVPLLARYRKFEKACREVPTTLAVAKEAGANYILVPANKADALKAASCFANERYLVFGLGANACDQ